jgi:alpha-ketoglutarate-dependent taurine dioxygenase
VQTRPAFDILGTNIDGSRERNLLGLETDEVIREFKDAGVLLFSGFDVDTKIFERFTNRFSNDYMDHKGGGSLREVINKDGDKTILSVSYAHNVESQRTFPLALHSDRSYTKSQPPVMWFYCVRPAKEQGETLVCDGVKVCEGLSEGTRKLFKDKRIKYVRNYRDGEWQLWAQTDSKQDVERYCRDNDLALTFNADKSVTTEYRCHAVVKPRWTQREAFVNSMLLVLWQEEDLKRTASLVRMEDGSKIPQEAIDEVREVSYRLTSEIRWNPADIAMIDNTRMMHGRHAFNDPKREIYVRMCRSVPW